MLREALRMHERDKAGCVEVHNGARNIAEILSIFRKDFKKGFYQIGPTILKQVNWLQLRLCKVNFTLESHHQPNQIQFRLKAGTHSFRRRHFPACNGSFAPDLYDLCEENLLRAK